ncbi:MAG: hypothetical protein RL462_496 [Pseudomonadota bacterium]|jgi:hypothetical protein
MLSMFKRVLLVSLAIGIASVAVLALLKDKIALGAEAYLYGYPLVMMETTRVHSGHYIGPENQLRLVRQFPDASFKDVVRPNVDTLYTTAFLSMKEGPWVFEMPANTQRYELMPFMDAWTNVFASPGTRTLGQQGARYLLVGPNWHGEVPPGMTLLKSPTDMVWLIGRTQTNGSADYANVHQLQDRLALKKFKVNQAALTQVNTSQAPSDWQHSKLPSVPPVIQMRDMRTSEFFQRMMDLMVSNPPSPDDAAILNRMAQAHLVPGQAVNLNGLDHACLALGRWLAEVKVHKVLNTKSPDGAWSTPPLNLGAYGTDYNTRAAVAMVGLGANLPQDALYPNTALDQQGQPLKGQHRYRLHFKATQLPPVNAFWSITAYGHDEFLIANPLNRYALGDRDRLHFNADGSLDIWIQAQEPAQAHQRTNWLPVKDKSAFLLNARLYWPKEDALQGTWKMPALERLD